MRSLERYPMVWVLLLGMLFGLYTTTVHGFLGLGIMLFCMFWCYIWIRRYEDG